MGPGALIATGVSVIGFIVMFGIASAKGDYQSLIKTTLENDENQRKRMKSKWEIIAKFMGFCSYINIYEAKDNSSNL